MKKIIGFAASTSSGSINKSFVEYTLSLFKDDYQVELLDLNDFPCPLFSEDHEKIHYPQGAINFLEKIKACDAIICSMAEHNRNWTAAFKNLFDWCSRKELKVFQSKDMLLLSTSNGRRGALNSLEIALRVFPDFGANIKGHYSLGGYSENFLSSKGITNAELNKEFIGVVDRFKTDLA